MSHETQYAAFLIRWEDDGPETRWRSTVEYVYSGQKLHFMNKSELLDFLWESLYEDGMPEADGANARKEA